uniref:Uncharacterized protein n=1 Tax=viral metagenome TaxID=1070528 RepID=A0A6M3IU83_9ZZZZ
MVRQLRGETLEFHTTGEVWEFLRECKTERPDDYDPVDIVRTVVGICPFSFLTKQTEYLLSVVSLFLSEDGIHTFPYPMLGIDNPAIFFQAAIAIMDETARVQNEAAQKKKGGDK